MGRGFRVYFDVPELDRAIREFSIYDSRKLLQLEDVVLNSTKQITKDARKLAPRRQKKWAKSKSGKPLRRSIRSKFNKREIAGYVMAKKSTAHWMEHGVKEYTPRKIPARAPKPFMMPAFEKEKPNLINEIERIYTNS